MNPFFFILKVFYTMVLIFVALFLFVMVLYIGSLIFQYFYDKHLDKEGEDEKQDIKKDS